MPNYSCSSLPPRSTLSSPLSAERLGHLCHLKSLRLPSFTSGTLDALVGLGPAIGLRDLRCRQVSHGGSSHVTAYARAPHSDILHVTSYSHSYKQWVDLLSPLVNVPADVYPGYEGVYRGVTQITHQPPSPLPSQRLTGLPPPSQAFTEADLHALSTLPHLSALQCDDVALTDARSAASYAALLSGRTSSIPLPCLPTIQALCLTGHHHR